MAVFLVGMARRGMRDALTPVHPRRELYPVPHEGGKDGSYFEELDWWEKPRHSSMMGELKVMVPEILLLVGLWEHNRKLWFASFPFHAGPYLTVLFLASRLPDPGLRLYAVPAAYFNLGLILTMALVALVSWAAIDLSFSEAREYAEGLVSFGQPADTSPLIVTQSLLLSLFLVYLPFTHMTHFVGKFFTYHSVRWDDAPNLSGGDYERLIADLLQS